MGAPIEGFWCERAKWGFGAWITYELSETRGSVDLRELVNVVQGCVSVELLEALEVVVGQTVHRYRCRVGHLRRLRR